MSLTWEAIGTLVILLGAISTINIFTTRSIVRQELEKWSLRYRPLGECCLLHDLLGKRLDKIELDVVHNAETARRGRSELWERIDRQNFPPKPKA